MTRPTVHPSRRRPAAPGRSRRLAAVCGVLAVVLCASSGWGSVPLPVVGLLAVVVGVAELVVLPVRLGPSRWLVSLTEGAVGACLLLGEGAWSVVAVGAGVAAAQTVRRCPRRKRELDLAVRLLATAVAQALCGAVGGSLPGAVVGLTAFWLVTCGVLTIAVASVSSRPAASLLTWVVRTSALHTSLSAGAGLLAAGLALRAPLGLLGALLGVAVAGSACAHAAWRRGEARLYAHLAQTPGRTPDASARLLVTATARLLRGADVELVVLDAGPARRYTGDEHGHAPASVVALDEPWVRDALATRGVRRSREDDRPTVCAVLSGEDGPTAVLRARRAVGAPDFAREDRRSLEVLVERAGAWLAAPADGGPAAGQPAVVRVQASVERLDALAVRGAASAEVVAELLELERAVASLLGSAVQPGAAVPQQRPGPAAEWTTTGAVR